MPKIIIDNQPVECRPGVPVLQAAVEAGWDVPHYCYHPGLSIAGNCRICLVETEGPRGFALGISCHMRPAPGMKVRTPASSDNVKKARNGVMEFLLVNHPLDCPICDKAGECTLQEHYMGQGKHESRLDDAVGKQYKGGADHRFIDSKGHERGGKKIDLGPSIVLDQDAYGTRVRGYVAIPKGAGVFSNLYRPKMLTDADLGLIPRDAVWGQVGNGDVVAIWEQFRAATEESNPDLMTQIEKSAAASHSTVTALIEETLRESLARRRRSRQLRRVILPTYGKKGLLPGVDLDNIASLFDAMESSLDPARR